MKANEKEIAQVLLGFKNEMDDFVNRLYDKRFNIASGLKTMDLTTIDSFDQKFGKEMFYVSVTDLIRENEIRDLLND